MANIEQKVADTLELMALTSEAVLENGTKLDAVDNNVNGVGQSVVELHKTAEQVHFFKYITLFSNTCDNLFCGFM